MNNWGNNVMLDCWNEEQLSQMEKEYFSNKGNPTIKKASFILSGLITAELLLLLYINT